LLHPKTLQGIEPPINDDSDWFLLKEIEYEYELNVPYTENFKFIYIGVEDYDGKVVYRNDLNIYTPKLKVSFKSFTKPVKWVYWPVNLNNEWINKIETNL
jgi:hypothetical protein